ncbi:MAG TPA: threonine--tRNA ligase [Polyangiaceae bacterium]|nr:threonine--tRNA ligase [Polyangiaceae bacterium]
MLEASDHRVIGQQLDLFHLQEEAPGMVFWHPRGYALYRALESVVRAWTAHDGFEEVRTPELLRSAIWEQSGHWQNFREHMFAFEDDGKSAAMKPVNCPGHAQIVRKRSLSHRDLPLRLAEFGVVHRDEPSGVLHGLMRLRQFTQDDGHVFLAEVDIEREVARFCSSLHDFYEALGFSEIAVSFATRPPQRAGSDELWDRAEHALENAARRAGLQTRHKPGEGAFYGPKLEFELRDRHGRAWQCGTIQLDFVLPERFELSYDDGSGKRVRPAMLHRAMLGSLERFLGILLEHHAGRVPAWLAPEQVRVLPVHREQRGCAEELVLRLRERGLRASCDAGDATLGRRVARAYELCVPLLWVVGAREASNGTVAERSPAGTQRLLPVVSALDAAANASALPQPRRPADTATSPFSD